MFMVCECEDGFEPERDWGRYAVHHPRIADWEALMGTVQVPPPESKDGAKWVEMAEIFSLTKQLGALAGASSSS